MSDHDPAPYEAPIHQLPGAASGRPLRAEPRPAWQLPFLDLALGLSRHRLLFLSLVTVGVVAGIVQLLHTPSFYRSSAVAILMSREKPVLSASIDTGSFQTAEDSARRGPSAALTLPPDAELYVTLLRSRPILEKLAARFRGPLTRVQGLAPDERSDAVIDELLAMLTVTGTENGLVTVSATSRDPHLSAELANAVMAEGEAASKDVERGLLLEHAAFLESSAATARARLEEAKHEFELFSEKHDLIDPDNQGAQSLLEVRQLNRETQQLRSELQARLLHYTDDDPEVRRLRERIDENERNATEIRDNIARGVRAEEFGRLTSEYDALKQVMRFRRDLYMTLSAQADIFRIRADQPAGSMAVVRRAIAPSTPAGPSKKKILGVSLALALIVAVLVSLLLEQVAQMRRDPDLSDTLGSIRENLLASPRAELSREWETLRPGRRRKAA